MIPPGPSKSVAILLSSQARRPTGQTDWIRQTSCAVAEIKQKGFGIVSSVGLSTWDLITSLAAIHQVPLRLLIPNGPKGDFGCRSDEIISDFGLQRELVDFIPVFAESATSEQAMMSRDQSVIEQASELWPISLRPGGRMSSAIDSALAQGKVIERRFEIAYNARHPFLKYIVDHSRLSPQIRNISSEYLVHWTRTANHPWPGERTVDYWQSVVASDSYCRSALDTLRRVLYTKCIRASSRHMPAGFSTVAFSSLSPVEVLPLMRWRARYGEMSFEPYGIGIRLDSAMAQQILPVSYVDSHRPTCVTPWLCQSIGAKTDWRAEREYRHLGNFDLGKCADSDLIVFTLHQSEADAISRDFGLKAISFY